MYSVGWGIRAALLDRDGGGLYTCRCRDEDLLMLSGRISRKRRSEAIPRRWTVDGALVGQRQGEGRKVRQGGADVDPT